MTVKSPNDRSRTTSRSRPLTSLAYVPVRQCQDDQHAWLDTGALALSPDQARAQAAACDALIPSWAAINPVVRITRVTLTEESV